MGLNDYRPCPCGSGKESHWELDARGIPLARVCSACKAEKLKGFRKEVLTNARYSHHEPIDPQ